MYSGGDSLKALRFYEEIEMSVGKAVPGLLEVILSHSIEEVYRHILKMLFADEEQSVNPDNAVKRKLRGNSGDEFHGKYIKLTSERGLEIASRLIPFIALNRGNSFFSMNFTKSSVQPKNTVQVGVEPLQQLSSLHSKIPGVMKSDVQGSEMENRTLTLENKANKNDHSSVQQIHAECSHSSVAELSLCVRWKSNTRKCVDASPLVIIPAREEVSAAVYIGSHSHAMQAIDLDLGEIKWEKTLGDRIESSACVSKCGNFIVVGMSFLFRPSFSISFSAKYKMNDRESRFLSLVVLHPSTPISASELIYCKIETEGRSNLSFLITSDGLYLT